MNQTIRDSLLSRLRSALPKEMFKEAKELFFQCYAQLFPNRSIIDDGSFSEEHLAHSITLMECCLCSVLFTLRYDQEEKPEEKAARVLRLYPIFIDYESTRLLSVPSQELRYFDPEIMILRAHIRYLEKINRPLAHVNPRVSLINDIFETIFRKASGSCQVLVLGLYSDSFVSWRTLHEAECIIKLLVEGGETVRQAYLDHIAYNNAYRNQEAFSKEELDSIFAEIKEKMHEHGLKSKDMKKFIEYGWLYASPLYDPSDVLFKLNFRDGVEKLAGLMRYSSIYEGASEIAHSSSAFFYANADFCRDISLAMTYQSMERMVQLYYEYMKVHFTFHPEQLACSKALGRDVQILARNLSSKVQMEEER